MIRRDAIKTMGGVAIASLVGMPAVAASPLPVACYKTKLVYHKFGYPHLYAVKSDKEGLSFLKLFRVLLNSDEIMGVDRKIVPCTRVKILHNPEGSTVDDVNYDDGRQPMFDNWRSGMAVVKKEDAEFLIHPETRQFVRAWGELIMAEHPVAYHDYAKNLRIKVYRSVYFTNKTQFVERESISDYRDGIGLNERVGLPKDSDCLPVTL